MGRVSLIGELGLAKKKFLEESSKEGKHEESEERRNRRTLKEQDIIKPSCQ